MKVNEFRIGNLVMCNGKSPFLFKKVTYRITDIKESIQCVNLVPNNSDAKSAWCMCKDIIPIQLSDSLLKEYGWNDVGKFYKKGKTYLNIGEKSYIDTRNITNVIINCTYLHQLQNMYYAVTGEEMK